MSVDQRETRVVVTQRQVTQVVTSGTQGPKGGTWLDWDDIPGKPDFPALYDPLGAADDAQAAAISAAAADATSKVNALSATTTATLNGKEPTITAGTTSQYWRGDKSWRDFATDVRAAVLTGLSTATSTVVAATDSVLVAIGKLQAQITGHTGSTSNPHSVTKAQVGLGNVDNTSDANKPVSTAQQTALNLKADKTTTISAGTGLSGGGDLSTNRTLSVAYGTTAGTAAQGNDSRLSDAREWTAATVDQAEAEAGTATTRRAWTAQRVRQAIVAWWNSITNIDGKNIGATTAGTGRFTTLTTTGSATVGGAAPTATIAGTTLFPSTTPFVEVVRTSGDAPQDTLMVLRQSGLAAAAHKKRVGMLFKHSSEGSTGESVKMTGIWSETVSSYSNTPELVVSVGDAERARFTPSATDLTGNLSVTGNTTLGDAPTDTVFMSGRLATGGVANASAVINVGPAELSGTAQSGIVCWPTVTTAATVAADGISVRAQIPAGSQTVARSAAIVILSATRGAGATITDEHGILIADRSQGTNNYGITSQVSAGTNKRNLNIAGTAESYLAGNLSIGATSATQERLEVTASAPGGVITVARLRNSGSTAGTTARLLLTTNTGVSGGSNSSGIESVATSESHTDCVIGTTSFNSYAEKLRVTSTGVVRPAADNTQSLGNASFRWGTVFAGTGTINTSDATLKTSLRDFTDAELDAIGDCRLGIFQWLDAVAEKGDAARLHPGVIAQQIMSAFESRDLDPLRYAPICRDRMTSRVQTDSVPVWKRRPVMVKEIARDERIEIIDGVPTVVVTEREVEAPKTEMRQLIGADGKPVTEEVQARDTAGEPLYLIEDGKNLVPVMIDQPVMHPCPVEEDYLDFKPVFEERDAGWRYGIRYSQLLVMIAAHERRERERLAARIEALEAA